MPKTNRRSRADAGWRILLAEGWGSREAAERHDWDYRIRKDLGETGKLRWRSETDREKFLAAENRKYKGWDGFVRTKYRA